MSSEVRCTVGGTGWVKKASLFIVAITLSTANQLGVSQFWHPTKLAIYSLPNTVLCNTTFEYYLVKACS